MPKICGDLALPLSLADPSHPQESDKSGKIIKIYLCEMKYVYMYFSFYPLIYYGYSCITMFIFCAPRPCHLKEIDPTESGVLMKWERLGGLGGEVKETVSITERKLDSSI